MSIKVRTDFSEFKLKFNYNEHKLMTKSLQETKLSIKERINYLQNGQG